MVGARGGAVASRRWVGGRRGGGRGVGGVRGRGRLGKAVRCQTGLGVLMFIIKNVLASVGHVMMHENFCRIRVLDVDKDVSLYTQKSETLDRYI